MKPVTWHFCLLLVSQVTSTRVLDFAAATFADSSSPVSTVVITNSPAEVLPQRFILCFSIKHAIIDNKSPFIIYGENKEPWLAFSFWISTAGLTLYAGVQRSTWIRLHLVEKPWTHVWMPVCADVDTESGGMSVTLNGGLAIKANVGKLKTQIPNQFIGQITNINIFRHTKSIDIANMNLCLGGDFMNWSSTELEQRGIGMNIIEDDNFCDHKDTYEILLPLVASWHTADHHCKRLGHMTQINNAMQLNTTASLAKNSGKSCSGIWTAISDELEEGEYRDTETGDILMFLPWGEGQPNGGIDQNRVIIDFNLNALYNDLTETEKMCVSCTLKTTKTFKLRGLCKETDLGKKHSKIFVTIF